MPDNGSVIRKLLLTPVEAAEALSMSPRTLWTLTHDEDIPPEDRIPCIKIGRLVRYDPAALQRWIEKKGEAGAAAP